MKKGLIYFRIYYPGYFGLNDGSYFIFKIKNVWSNLLIYKHINVLDISDLNNELLYDKDPPVIKTEIPNALSKTQVTMRYHDQPVFSFDYDKDVKRIFFNKYFTTLIISKEVENVTSPSKSDYEWEPIVDYFISLYRIVTTDNNIKLSEYSPIIKIVNDHCLIPYDKDDLILNIPERLTKKREVKFVFNQLSFNKEALNYRYIPMHDYSDAYNKLTGLCEKDALVEEMSSFLIHIDDRIKVAVNPKFVFLDLFIYLETLMYTFLTNKKIENGVSKNKLKDYENEIGIGYMINVELPIFIPNLDENKKNVLDKIDMLRKKRNQIVHKREDVSMEEVIQARNSVNDFFKLIRNL